MRVLRLSRLTDSEILCNTTSQALVQDRLTRPDTMVTVDSTVEVAKQNVLWVVSIKQRVVHTIKQRVVHNDTNG
eukprot:6479511-Amphidinium_carterae.1